MINKQTFDAKSTYWANIINTNTLGGRDSLAGKNEAKVAEG